MEKKSGFFNNLYSFVNKNLIAVVFLVVVISLFIPIPKVLIDILMILNFALSFFIVLNVLSMKRAADFSIFPRLILFCTFFGLSINIASTRNILTNPVSSDVMSMTEQSEMVKVFASIVAGDNVFIGFVMFIIYTVFEILVVTKGADRISEVTARFTLDAMNNKMFDVQNDLNAGIITEEEAKFKKNQLREEIDFYSRMDGSSKFVSGNVKAGIFITVVNLLGGILTGWMADHQFSMGMVSNYAKLTIGDGLVSQIPSLLLSYSTGLLITSPGSDSSFTEDVKKQFSSDSKAYTIIGVLLLLFALVFGLVFKTKIGIAFAMFGALFIFIGNRFGVQTKKALAEKEQAAKDVESTKQANTGVEESSSIAKLDDLSLEIGYGLISLVDRAQGAELLERVQRIRREQALDLGLVVPPIHIMDQIELLPEEYSVKIRGIEVGRSRIKLGHYLCINTGGVSKDNEIVGEKTKDPSFGMDAIWLPESKRSEAERVGYAVIDPPTIIATHLTEIIRRHAPDILSRQTVHSIVEEVKKTNSIVVDEVVSGSNPFSYGEIEAILKALLAEQVSIRNMVTILETISDYGKVTRDTYMLTAKVREALGAQICLQYVDEEKKLKVLTLSQSISEKLLNHKVEVFGKAPNVGLNPVDTRNIVEAITSSIASLRERAFQPIIMCPEEVRFLVRALSKTNFPGVVILSINEILAAGNNLQVEILGEING